MPEQRHALIVSFDGLRPDLIERRLTPNICRLQDIGVTLAKHRTIYPSETRVAFPSLVTGATSNRHGMVGNQYVDRSVHPQRHIDTSDAVLLDQLNRDSGGRLMTAATLGEVLAANGRSLAVLATNTPGTTRLFHHKAEAFGHVRLSGHFREACTPDELLSEIEERFGVLPALPPKGEPDIAGQEFITSAFLELVWPRLRPDVSILSYGEPDVCSHLNGTAATKTREVIAFCDKQLGRVIDWWEAEGKASGVQLAVISDHGHITAHTRVSVADSLREAGFAPGTVPAPGVDVVVVPGQVGALYLADRSPAQLARVVGAITELPWCGPVFTAPRNKVEGIAPGSLSTHLVLADHERAPDIYFSFRADDGIDPFGMVGGTFYDNDRRAGLGVHGGLHPKELAAVGIVAGSAFQSSAVSQTPSNICDFAPTILHLFGIEPPAGMTGRVLRETLARREALPDLVAAPEVFEATLGSYTQVLRRLRLGSSVYIEEGLASS